MPDIEITPEVVEKTPDAVVPAKVEPKVDPAPVVEPPKAPTIAELTGKKEEQPDTVPLKAFLDMKKDNKELKKSITDLTKAVKDGATKSEISADIKEMAEEYDADENLIKAIIEKTKGEADASLEKKLKPFLDKEKGDKIDTLFNENYDKAIEAMPEYKDVANKEVIKTLALDPKNKDKTFADILDSSYGHLIGGKKTLETAQPGAKKLVEGEVDVDRASSDKDYFKEVMADPTLKKKYNEGLEKRLNL